MRIDIYGDNISYVTDEVSSIPVSQANLNEDNRMKFVTDVAAISRGKYESKNPEVRYKALMKEAALNTPSRPLEFLPVVIRGEMTTALLRNVFLKDGKVVTMGFAQFVNGIAKFSYVETYDVNKFVVYTNMRCLVNAGIKYEDIPYNTEEELSNFKILRACIPMFVFGQFPATHTQITSEAQSDRVSENNDYYLPNDILERIKNNMDKILNCHPHFEVLLNKVLNNDEITNAEKMKNLKYIFTTELSQTYVQTILKTLGYPREIWSRAIYYFKYKETVMSGWFNNPYAWRHAFVERNAKPEQWKNWTQDATREFVTACCKIIES